MPPPLLKRARRSLRSALVRAAIQLVGLLPLRLALGLGALAGRLAYHLAAKDRRLALEHLALAFPERSAEERRAIAREMFVRFGLNAFELAAVRRYDARLESYVEFEPPGLLQEVFARGKGIVFVTGHIGSWELLARRIARAGIPSVVIGRPNSDARLNALVDRFRTEGGVSTLWRENPDTGRAIIRTFRQGKALGILIDQDTRVQGVFVPFFGRLAFTPRAAADFAVRFGAPLMVGTIHRKGQRASDGHRLEMAEIPVSRDPTDREAEVVRLTAICTAALEQAIRKHPTEWVWMHRRWRTRPPGEAPEPSKADAEIR